MRDQLLHLLNVELHGKKLVEQAESSGRAACIATHPGFHMLNLVVDLINHLIVVLYGRQLLVILLQDNGKSKFQNFKKDRYECTIDERPVNFTRWSGLGPTQRIGRRTQKQKSRNAFGIWHEFLPNSRQKTIRRMKSTCSL